MSDLFEMKSGEEEKEKTIVITYMRTRSLSSERGEVSAYRHIDGDMDSSGVPLHDRREARVNHL
jgi:hypothetical protein